MQALLDEWRAEVARTPLAMSEAEACKVLGLKPNSDGVVGEDDLKSAYRSLARKYIPASPLPVCLPFLQSNGILRMPFITPDALPDGITWPPPLPASAGVNPMCSAAWAIQPVLLVSPGTSLLHCACQRRILVGLQVPSRQESCWQGAVPSSCASL